jgi:nucleoid-associated protein YgaU
VPGRPDHVAELDPAWWPTTPGPVTGADGPPADEQAGGATGSAPRANGVGAAAGRPRTVSVAPGDTLWGLAARHLGAGASAARISAEWPRWYAANRLAIGPDADRLRPGIKLLVPAPHSDPALRAPEAADGAQGTAQRHAGATS